MRLASLRESSAHSYAGNGDEGADIGCTHARMCTVVAAHVDQLGSASDASECGFDYGFRLSYESDYRAVGGFSGIYIEKAYAFDTFYGIGN